MQKTGFFSVFGPKEVEGGRPLGIFFYRSIRRLILHLDHQLSRTEPSRVIRRGELKGPNGFRGLGFSKN